MLKPEMLYIKIKISDFLFKALMFSLELVMKLERHLLSAVTKQLERYKGLVDEQARLITLEEDESLSVRDSSKTPKNRF
jgi:hypothetical protein